MRFFIILLPTFILLSTLVHFSDQVSCLIVPKTFGNLRYPELGHNFRLYFEAVRPVVLFIRLFDVKGKRSTILDEGYKYTVAELKNMLLKEMDVSGHILRLYFEGQELWIPDRTLASYRVRPGDTVDIYLENIAEQLAIRFGNQDKSPDGRLAE